MGICNSSGGGLPTQRNRDNTHMALNQKARGGSGRRQSLNERLRAKCDATESDDFVVSDTGRKGSYQAALYAGFDFFGRKKCQDAFITTHFRADEDAKGADAPHHLFAIFDGHGQAGTEVSQYLVEHLPPMLRSHLKAGDGSQKGVHMAFNKCFVDVQDQLKKNKKLNLTLSGSTGTCVLIQDEYLHVAWVGDSRAIMVGGAGKDLNVHYLTHPHNFDNKHERERAERAGATVRQSLDEYGREVGPKRVFQKGRQGPGLAVSRSFGDTLAHKLGVVVDPECITYKLDGSHDFVVVASDGVWDMLSTEEVANTVHSAQGAPGTAEKLVMQAAQRWIEGNHGLSDDISCIVVYLK